MLPTAHVAIFYSKLQLICSVLRASIFFAFEIDYYCNFVGFSLASTCQGIVNQSFAVRSFA